MEAHPEILQVHADPYIAGAVEILHPWDLDPVGMGRHVQVLSSPIPGPDPVGTVRTARPAKVLSLAIHAEDQLRMARPAEILS